jgi:hypothetical protein
MKGVCYCTEGYVFPWWSSTAFKLSFEESINWHHSFGSWCWPTYTMKRTTLLLYIKLHSGEESKETLLDGTGIIGTRGSSSKIRWATDKWKSTCKLYKNLNNYGHIQATMRGTSQIRGGAIGGHLICPTARWIINNLHSYVSQKLWVTEEFFLIFLTSF